MNMVSASEWLLSFLAPLFTLSYLTETPASTDSFPDSNYYTIGPRDAYFVVGCIAVMAILRDICRIYIMEPFAEWFLTPKVEVYKRQTHINGTTNGVANGLNGNENGHDSSNSNRKVLTKQNNGLNKKLIRRRVLRFAEQGWSMIYYTSSWSYGMVCPS